MKNQSSTVEKKYLIGGKNYQSIQLIGDIAIAWEDQKKCEVFIANSISTEAQLYTINGVTIDEVLLPYNHDFVLLKTKEHTYARDFKNRPLEEAKDWADYYFEPYTNSFYRKDERGNWYDIEGYRLDTAIFLKGDVLCSLLGKVSKKSMSFKYQEVLISPRQELIQVGKLVYDNRLELIHYFGEKITGLGAKNISFGGSDVLQEIYLGLNQTAFINEFTKEPFLINNEEVTRHVQSVQKGKHRYEVFQSRTREYVIEDRSDCMYCLEEEPVHFDWSTYLTINKQPLALVKKQADAFFIDVKTKQPFLISNIEERIIQIDLTPISIEKEFCYNIKTPNLSFVYNATKDEIFTLDSETIQPEKLEIASNFDNYLCYATINEKRNLFYKKQNKLVQLGKEALTVSQIDSPPKDKLLNALDTEGQPLVIDARKGLSDLQLAAVEAQKIVEVFDQPHTIGNKILQNVLMQSVGGNVPRVINLNTEQLSLFILPIDLTENTEQAIPSNFAANPIVSIDFESPITIGVHSFLAAQFLSFLDQIHPLILQHKNGRPIQLDSVGHKMELVTGFDKGTQNQSYFLGEHQLIGAHTLTEDLKEKELLLSLNTLGNWLPFYDAYLPPFRRVVELQGAANWKYLLLELRGVASTVEYVAVENQPPYRLLVETRRGKPIPKIVKSTEKVLKSPEEITAIRQFFLLDPRYSLIGVD